MRVNWIWKASVAAAFALAAMPGFSQESGMHGELLKRALTESAKGKCPAEIMSPMLRGACEQQMPAMGQALASKGAIVDVEYVGTQGSQMGPAEVYKVKFSAGNMMWMINTGPDGKIMVLFSPG